MDTTSSRLPIGPATPFDEWLEIGALSPTEEGAILAGWMMRIDYDRDHDTVYVRLSESPRTAESDEIEPGVIVDYGPDGQVVGFELMDAQRRGPWADWMQWVEALQTRVTRS